MAKSFFSGIVPVDEVDGLGDLARLDLHRHAVAQQAVDGLVVAVERAVVVVRLGAQLVQRDADLRRGVAALGQPGREQLLFDVAVAVAVGPVAEVAVAQLVAEQGDDAVLRGALGLADGTHVLRIRVTRSCQARLAHLASAHPRPSRQSAYGPACAAFQRLRPPPLRTSRPWLVSCPASDASESAPLSRLSSPRGARPAA